MVQLFNGAYASGGELNWDGHNKTQGTVRPPRGHPGPTRRLPSSAICASADCWRKRWWSPVHRFGRMPDVPERFDGEGPQSRRLYLLAHGRGSPQVSIQPPDELGRKAVENVLSLYDFNATILICWTGSREADL